MGVKSPQLGCLKTVLLQSYRKIFSLLNIPYHHFEVIIMKDFRKFNRKLEIVESLGGYRLPNICEQQQAVLHIIERAESNRGADREWTMQKHVVLDLFM